MDAPLAPAPPPRLRRERYGEGGPALPAAAPSWAFVLTERRDGAEGLAPRRRLLDVIAGEASAIDALRREERALAAARAGAGPLVIAPWTLLREVPGEALAARADHAITVEAFGASDRPLLHKVFFVRDAACVEVCRTAGPEAGVVVGEPAPTERLTAEVRRIGGLERRLAEPPAAACVPLVHARPLAALRGAGLGRGGAIGFDHALDALEEAGLDPETLERLEDARLVTLAQDGVALAPEPWWLDVLGEVRSLRLTKTEVLGGRGTAQAAWVELARSGAAWCRARIEDEGGAGAALALEPVAWEVFERDLLRWIAGRAPWSEGPFDAGEANRLREAHDEWTRWQLALTQVRAALAAAYPNPLVRRRIDAEHEVARQENLAARTRRLDAVEPDRAAVPQRWGRTPSALRIAATEPGACDFRPYLTAALGRLSRAVAAAPTGALEGTPLARNYAAGPVLRWPERGGIDQVRALCEPAIVVAQRIPLEVLARLSRFLPRVRGFVLEDGDLSYEEEIFYASSNRATVVGIAGLREAVRDAAWLFIDGPSGRVFTAMDAETAARYEAQRLVGRPGSADQDVEIVMARRLEREALARAVSERGHAHEPGLAPAGGAGADEGA
jgi:hypothetical protein